MRARPSWPSNVPLGDICPSQKECLEARQRFEGALRQLAGHCPVFAEEHHILYKTPPPSIRQGWGTHNYFFVNSSFKKLSEPYCLHLSSQADLYRGLSTVVVKDTVLLYFAKTSLWSVFHEYTPPHTPFHSPFSLVVTGSRDDVSSSRLKAFRLAGRGTALH